MNMLLSKWIDVAWQLYYSSNNSTYMYMYNSTTFEENTNLKTNNFESNLYVPPF